MSCIQSHGIEDMNAHWGGRWNCSGQVVLDVGCSNGDSSEVFLNEGASFVVGVDERNDYVDEANALARSFGLPLRAICRSVNSADDWIELLTDVKPGCVKSDCEGGEIGLLGVPSELIRTVASWQIEVHSPEIRDALARRFEDLGYRLDVRQWYHLWILHCERTEDSSPEHEGTA